MSRMLNRFKNEVIPEEHKVEAQEVLNSLNESQSYIEKAIEFVTAKQNGMVAVKTENQFSIQ